VIFRQLRFEDARTFESIQHQCVLQADLHDLIEVRDDCLDSGGEIRRDR